MKIIVPDSNINQVWQLRTDTLKQISICIGHNEIEAAKFLLEYAENNCFIKIWEKYLPMSMLNQHRKRISKKLKDENNAYYYSSLSSIGYMLHMIQLSHQDILENYYFTKEFEKDLSGNLYKEKVLEFLNKFKTVLPEYIDAINNVKFVTGNLFMNYSYKNSLDLEIYVCQNNTFLLDVFTKIDNMISINLKN